ncbi:hypothetical protein FOZ62_001299 [Perkinsus olseni]|uniref:Uncharacterized protein n=1 Tax=Perkinsus olseni TaxID=32597 RepID=A0A7J6S818_PEROL|nr:hypothetical protein FOZ62_001299 [Perkinsus olseni]
MPFQATLEYGADMTSLLCLVDPAESSFIIFVNIYLKNLHWKEQLLLLLLVVTTSDYNYESISVNPISATSPFYKNNLLYHQLHPRINPLTPLSLPRLRLPLLQLSEDLIGLPNLGILFKPPLGSQPQVAQSDDHDESL